MESVNSRLKRLRAAAVPPISIREMADKLGIAHATYHNYERPSGFKARYLPMGTARKIAAVLADRQVNPDEVLALAGIGVDETSTPGLSAGEERLLTRFRLLGPDQRRAIMVLIESMTSSQGGILPSVHGQPEQSATEGKTIHGQRQTT